MRKRRKVRNLGREIEIIEEEEINPIANVVGEHCKWEGMTSSFLGLYEYWPSFYACLELILIGFMH